jgi:DNA repair exonuclease SbcCD ATPase subunit
MALKDVVDKLEDVDEKYRGFYTEKDGKHHLDEALRVTPDPDAGKLDEFRNNNKALFEANAAKEKQIADLKAAMEKTNTKAAETVANVEKARQTDSERIADLEKKHQEAEEREAKTKAEAARTKLRSAIVATGSEQGVNKGALNDFADLMVDRFAAQEDGSHSLALGGETVMSPTKAGKVADVDEAIGVYLTQDAGKHWLAPSSGDGAGGDGGGGDGTRTITQEEARNNWGTYEKDIASGKVVVAG